MVCIYFITLDIHKCIAIYIYHVYISPAYELFKHFDSWFVCAGDDTPVKSKAKSLKRKAADNDILLYPIKVEKIDIN